MSKAIPSKPPLRYPLSRESSGRKRGPVGCNGLLSLLIVVALTLGSLALPSTAAAQAPTPWTPQGPAPELNAQEDLTNVATADEPVTGNVVSIAASPTNADLLYIAGVNGGVWKSTNATAANPTWTPLTDNLKSLSMGAIALDLTDATGQTLLAGTGRYSGFGSLGDDLAGLYYTTNGGTTWTVTTDAQLSGAGINGVAARGATLMATSTNGLFRTTGGPLGTWSKISGTGVLPNAPAVGLAADPANTSRFYATFSGASGGIFRTDDLGATWTNVTTGISGIASTTTCFNAAVGPGVVYAILNGAANALYRSANNGATWTALDAPAGSYSCTNAASGIGLSADKTNANLVYMATYATSVYRIDASKPAGSQVSLLTVDGSTYLVAGVNTAQTSVLVASAAVFPATPPFGITIDSEQMNVTAVTPTSWYYTLTVVRGFNGTTVAAHSNSATVIPPPTYGSPHGDYTTLVYDANGGLLAGSHGGVFRLATPGSAASATNYWVPKHGNLALNEIHDIAYDHVSHVLLGGIQDNSVAYQLAQGSQAWARGASLSGDGGDTEAADIGGGQSARYGSAQNLGGFRRHVYNAANGLVSNTAIGTAMITDPQFVTPLAVNAINPQRLLIGGSGNVWESPDMGATIASAFPTGATPVGVNRPHAIVYGGQRNGVANPDVFYIGSGSKIYKRTVAGGAVTEATALPTGVGTIRDIVMDTADWMHVFAVDNDQVFRTTDGGATWTDITGSLISSGLSSAEITTVEFVAGPSPYIAVGTRSGVFASLISNLGTWVKLGSSLPDVPVFELAYDAKDNVLAVGTLGRGGWLLSNASAAFVPSNVAPVLALSGPTTANEGTTQYSFSFTVTDPGDRFTISNPTITGGSLVPGSLVTTATGGSFKVTFPDGPATATISLQVTDSTGLASNTATTSVTVANVIPSAVTINGAPTNPTAGTVINLTNTVIDPSAADQAAGFTYLWFVYKPTGAASIPNGSGAAYSFTPSIAGTYTVYLNATDKDGGTRQGSQVINVVAAALSTAATSATETQGTADTNADALANVNGQPQASVAGDPTLAAQTLTAAAATLTVNAASVTVFEGQVTENSGTFANANGNPVTLSASVGTLTRTSNPQTLLNDTFDQEPLGHKQTTLSQWNVTQNSIDIVGPSLNDAFPGNGNYIALAGTKNAAIQSKTTFNLGPGEYQLSFELATSQTAVNNRLSVSLGTAFAETFTPPTTALTPVVRRITVASALAAPLRFAETGTPDDANGTYLNDVQLVRLDPPVGSWSWSFATNDGPAQSQDVIIQATDKVNGEVTTLPFRLVVNNGAPSAALANSGAVNEGSTGTVSFSSQLDPSSVDMAAGFHYAYDFDNDGVFEVGGDGAYANASTAASVTVPASFLAEGPGARTVRARIIDKDGGYTDYTTDITINNAAPTASVSGLAGAVAGQIVNFVLTAADPSTADQRAGFTYSINWGDGSPRQTVGPVAGNGDATASHAYATAGNYTIQVTATDRNGATSPTPGSAAITVNALTASSLQALIATLPQVNLAPTSDAALQNAVAAINGLAAPAAPVAITIILSAGPYSGVTLGPPSGIVLNLAGNDTADTVGTQIASASSPAVTVTSGEVFVQGNNLTTSSDGPTALVTGGHLTLAQGSIQESTSANNVAVAVTAGNLTLEHDSTMNVSEQGAFVATYDLDAVMPPAGIDADLSPNIFTVNGARMMASHLSATSLSSSANPSTAGLAVTFSARINVEAEELGAATGTVTFYEGATVLGAGKVSEVGPDVFVATFTTSALAAGTHTIRAVYEGNEVYVLSAATATQEVRPFAFRGFFPPVANPPTLNQVSAGQNIVFAFSLGGNFGLNIFAAGSPLSQQFNCSTGALMGSSTLTLAALPTSYAAGSDKYSYTAKTDKTWAGTCRQFNVRLIDGTDHLARFQFQAKAASAGQGDEENSGNPIYLPFINR